MKHTLGQWKTYLAADARPHVVFSESDKFNICEIRHHGYALNRSEEHAANALLIAAAPDLLEAVETLLNVAQNGCETPEDKEFLLDHYAKLIKKAKGEL